MVVVKTAAANNDTTTATRNWIMAGLKQLSDLPAFVGRTT
jgi:hypothetical protein